MLWQYKTYLVAELPRYKDEKVFFKTVSISWAEEYERMTVLLEKKQGHDYVSILSEERIGIVIDVFERHQTGIVNAMKTGANNARAERLNGAIQELKTIGRGYRNTANFRTAILFFNGGLELFPHNSQ